MFGIFFGGIALPVWSGAWWIQMKRIAVISSDKRLERAVVLAIESSAAAAARAAAGRMVEVIPLGDGECGAAGDGTGIASCDKVVILGSAGFVSGRLSAAAIHAAGEGGRRPEIFVVSWQHDERTVVGLIESGVDQYMTFPLSLRRLCIKVLGLR